MSPNRLIMSASMAEDSSMIYRRIELERRTANQLCLQMIKAVLWIGILS